jgi:hypothetical protein
LLWYFCFNEIISEHSSEIHDATRGRWGRHGPSNDVIDGDDVTEIVKNSSRRKTLANKPLFTSRSTVGDRLQFLILFRRLQQKSIYSARRLMGSWIIESAAYCNQISLAQVYINIAQNTSVNWIIRLFISAQSDPIKPSTLYRQTSLYAVFLSANLRIYYWESSFFIEPIF